MAIFPCDRHGQRYVGPQRTAYPALLDGIVSMRQKRRLCQVCFRLLRAWCIENLRSADSEIEAVGCALCESQDTSVATFVTLYDHKSDREDWFGRVCAECAAGPVNMALFGVQAALEGF